MTPAAAVATSSKEAMGDPEHLEVGVQPRVVPKELQHAANRTQLWFIRVAKDDYIVQIKRDRRR
jgi:hypothetical protein